MAGFVSTFESATAFEAIGRNICLRARQAGRNSFTKPVTNFAIGMLSQPTREAWQSADRKWQIRGDGRTCPQFYGAGAE
jgi:hypothetical protein